MFVWRGCVTRRYGHVYHVYPPQCLTSPPRPMHLTAAINQSASQSASQSVLSVEKCVSNRWVNDCWKSLKAVVSQSVLSIEKCVSNGRMY